MNLLGLLGDEGADSQGLAERRGRIWEGVATEAWVWDRPRFLPRKTGPFSLEMARVGRTNDMYLIASRPQ